MRGALDLRKRLFDAGSGLGVRMIRMSPESDSEDEAAATDAEEEAPF